MLQVPVSHAEQKKKKKKKKKKKNKMADFPAIGIGLVVQVKASKQSPVAARHTNPQEYFNKDKDF